MEWRCQGCSTPHTLGLRMGAGLRAFCFFFSVLLSRMHSMHTVNLGTIRKRFAGFLRRGLQAIDFLTFWFPARVAGTGGSILMGKSLRGRVGAIV